MQRTRLAALGTILVLVGAACTTSPKVAAVTVSATTAGEGKSKTFAFDVPATIDGGRVDLTLDNSSGGAFHEIQLLSIDGEHSDDEVLQTLGTAGEGAGIPEWIGLEGGVGGVPKGGSSTTSLNLASGAYAFVCFIADHYTKGMFERVQVGEGEAADLPAADGTISAFDYGFELDGLEAGTNEFTFTNDGDQPHFAAVMAFEEGVTLEEAQAEIGRFANDEEPQLPEPEEVGSLAAIDPDRSLTGELTLESGRVYVFACWLSDREGGPPHAFKGMMTPVEVA